MTTPASLVTVIDEVPTAVTRPSLPGPPRPAGSGRSVEPVVGAPAGGVGAVVAVGLGVEVAAEAMP